MWETVLKLSFQGKRLGQTWLKKTFKDRFTFS